MLGVLAISRQAWLHWRPRRQCIPTLGKEGLAGLSCGLLERLPALELRRAGLEVSHLTREYFGAQAGDLVGGVCLVEHAHVDEPFEARTDLLIGRASDEAGDRLGLNRHPDSAPILDDDHHREIE